MRRYGIAMWKSAICFTMRRACCLPESAHTLTAPSPAPVYTCSVHGEVPSHPSVARACHLGVAAIVAQRVDKGWVDLGLKQQLLHELVGGGPNPAHEVPSTRGRTP